MTQQYVNSGIYAVPLDELEDMPTLAKGQNDDLKIDNHDGERVWLCRSDAADGMPWDNMVTVERYDGQRWVEVEWWEAR